MRRPRTGTSCEAKELRLLWDAHYLDACNFTADNILLCLTVILIIYFPGLGQWFRRLILRLGWGALMTTSEEEREREPPHRGQEAIHNAQSNAPGFAAPGPRVEEGQAAETQDTAQPRAGQAGTGDTGNRRQELLQEWARSHEYPVQDTQKYEQDRRFVMSSLSDLIVTTKENQDSLAEIAKRQQDAYEGTFISEQVIHDMEKSLDKVSGELQNVNRRFDAASTSQANDINALKAKVASLARGGSNSQAGPSSPTWPSLRGQGQNKGHGLT